MNGDYTAGGMWMAPDARPDDGLLDVVVIGDVTKGDFVRTFPKIYRGKPPLAPEDRAAARRDRSRSSRSTRFRSSSTASSRARRPPSSSSCTRALRVRVPTASRLGGAAASRAAADRASCGRRRGALGLLLRRRPRRISSFASRSASSWSLSASRSPCRLPATRASRAAAPAARAASADRESPPRPQGRPGPSAEREARRGAPSRPSRGRARRSRAGSCRDLRSRGVSASSPLPASLPTTPPLLLRAPSSP